MIDLIYRYYKREGFTKSIIKTFEVLAKTADTPWQKYSWRLPGNANDVEMRIIALRRSGHHAIINWILKQIRGRYCFLNDCQYDENPFRSCIKRNCRIASRFVEHNRLYWDQEIEGRLSKKGTLLFNYEDQFIKRADSVRNENYRSWIGESRIVYNVLILRDPYNLLASKLQWVYSGIFAAKLENLTNIVAIWKQHAREYLGDTDYLNSKIPVNFNFWFQDKNYRQRIAQQIGIRFTDKGLNEVAKWGPNLWKGTSFDGMTYDGKANRMKVLERWKQFRDDDFYRKLISDKELQSLSERIFGTILDERQLGLS